MKLGAAFVVLGVLLTGCATAEDEAKTREIVTSVRRNCIGDDGALKSYIDVYYACLEKEAKRLVPSGGSAGEIGQAASAGCYASRQQIETFEQACLQTYSSFGMGATFDSFYPRLEAGAAAVVSRTVLESRLPASR